jgi:hypothetical protein
MEGITVMIFKTNNICEIFERAEHFGVHIDRLTGKVRQVFNPNFEWEFAYHYVDSEIEYLRLERKEDWGVPLEPNGMTFEMCWNIQHAIEEGRNYLPGDEDK